MSTLRDHWWVNLLFYKGHLLYAVKSQWEAFHILTQCNIRPPPIGYIFLITVVFGSACTPRLITRDTFHLPPATQRKNHLVILSWDLNLRPCYLLLSHTLVWKEYHHRLEIFNWVKRKKKQINYHSIFQLTTHFKFRSFVLTLHKFFFKDKQ